MSDLKDLEETLKELDYDIKMLVKFSILGFFIFALMCFTVILYVALSIGVFG